MTSFPPDYAIYPVEEFIGFNLTTADSDISAAVLLQLRADATASGYFRIHIYGSKTMQIFFELSRILNVPEAKGVFLFYQCTSEDTAPSLNMTTTPFVDLLAGILDRTFTLTDAESIAIDPQEIVSRLSVAGPDPPPTGACVRWAVTASIDKRTELQFQALPVPLKLLKEAYHVDNTAVISVMTMPLPMEFGDGVTFNGPIPTIFSPNPDATRAALVADPIKAKFEFQKAVGRILFMEYLTLPAAVQYTAKFRKSVGRPAFVNSVTTSGEPQQKRIRLMEFPQGSIADSGKKLGKIKRKYFLPI
jgi:hypothetical protein